MGITVTRPVKQVEVITDMVLLQQLIQTANEYNEATTFDDTGMTEKEASDQRKHANELHAKLSELKEQTDEKTLILTLHGLNASKWNMAVIKHTSTDDGRPVKDFLGMVQDTIPDMIDEAQWKNGEKTTLARKEITEFITSLTDTQVMDLVEAAQELNSPVTSVPKAVTDLI